MRESCIGCVHYKKLSLNSGELEMYCDYILDMGFARETEPEDCHINGKYIPKKSKEGRGIMQKKSQEAWVKVKKITLIGYRYGN